MFHPPVDNPLFPLLSCHLVLLKHSTGEGERRWGGGKRGRIEEREGGKREKERREERGKRREERGREEKERREGRKGREGRKERERGRERDGTKRIRTLTTHGDIHVHSLTSGEGASP